MKRRRCDGDDDDYAEGPLLPYPLESKSDFLAEIGVDGEESGDGNAMSSGDVNNALGRLEAQHPMEEKKDDQDLCSASAQATSVEELRDLALSVDQDIPEHWKGLLSDDLLQVYFTTLSYAETKRTADDKLLSQYIPYDVKRFPPLARFCDRTSDNAFGVKPGWRWDGVVRGVGAL